VFAPLAILVSLAAADATAVQQPAAAPARSPRNANYAIAARLDPASRTITADEQITWRNVTTRPASSLQFHLYYNAWRNAQSTWMRERALAAAGDEPHRPGEWASIDVTSIRLLAPAAAGTEMTARMRFIAPDDANPDDRTVMEIPLDKAAMPGETIAVRLAWSAHVPRTFARTGAIDDYFFIAQWFPKLGVLEDAGWNCHQFHAATEFFSDFGVYDVRLTVPRGWTVGATGVERDATDAEAATTHHYYEEDVHDFAWTTSPAYVERRARFEHPSLPAVDIRLLLQPEHAGQAERHFAATRAALQHYGEWYGAYPYSHITVIDPAWQSGAGGMEYPTLFTAGTRWLAPADGTQPEDVTIHEAGHQFWYGIVATNEFENAWMDEGFNTFSTARAMWETFPNRVYTQRYFGGFVPWSFRDVTLTRDVDGDRMAPYRLAARQDVPATQTFKYWPATAGAITYSKTALWLHTLERYLGWPTLQRIMSTYFQRWAFRHPQPADFFAIANEVSGRDLSWYFDQVYRGSQTFDYGVDVFRSEPAGTQFRTVVVARRYGDGVFPVPVRVTFADGQQLVWNWDGRDRWKLFTVDRPSAATAAEVDPDRILVLDVNRTNNGVSRQPATPAATRKWSLTWLVWLQDQLLTYGFFV
jgi:aminopeptidase N